MEKIWKSDNLKNYLGEMQIISRQWGWNESDFSATMTYCTTRILSIYWVFLQYIRSIYSVFPEKSIFQQHFQIRVIYILCIYFWTGKKNRLKWEIHLYTWYILDIQLLKKMYFDRFRKEINQFWRSIKKCFL